MERGLRPLVLPAVLLAGSAAAAPAKPVALAAPALQSGRGFSLDALASAVAARLQGPGIKSVVADYDNTLEDRTPGGRSVAASPRLAAALAELKRLGAPATISTNHPFDGRNGMDALLGGRLGAAGRAGMTLVTSAGSRLYRYGPDGSAPAAPLWQAAPFSDEERRWIEPYFREAAAEAGLRRREYRLFHEETRSLLELPGAALPERVRDALERANARDGLGYVVSLKPYPTTRRGGAAYVQFAKADKGTGIRRAVELLKSEGAIQDESQVLILGDDFGPGGADLRMADALRGALAVSVGPAEPGRGSVLLSERAGAGAAVELLERLAAMLSARASRP